MRMLCVLPIAGLVLAGCGSAAAADPLTGTSWHLLSIDSMAPDEEPSTAVVPAPPTAAATPDGGWDDFNWTEPMAAGVRPVVEPHASESVHARCSAA